MAQDDSSASAQADLLARAVAGDTRAARDLTADLGSRAFGQAFRMLGSRAEAEDVAQDALMRLWRVAPDWEPGGAKVSTWLYRVVSNLCIDRMRKSRSLSLDDEAVAEPADPAPGAEAQMQAAERNRALQAALRTLPDRQRQAVVLRHIEGLGNPAIAEMMEISVEAVESLTSRGKRALAAILAGRREELGIDHEQR